MSGAKHESTLYSQARGRQIDRSWYSLWNYPAEVSNRYRQLRS